jgi:sortase (surface protein transpeptidase)
VGPAIILGHINGAGKPGVFERLPEMVVGDQIVVDGKVFTVYDYAWAPKNNFPADKVYSKTDKPELRLITCGGEFDQSTGHYKDNFILYAVMD